MSFFETLHRTFVRVSFLHGEKNILVALDMAFHIRPAVHLSNVNIKNVSA